MQWNNKSQRERFIRAKEKRLYMAVLPLTHPTSRPVGARPVQGAHTPGPLLEARLGRLPPADDAARPTVLQYPRGAFQHSRMVPKVEDEKETARGGHTWLHWWPGGCCRDWPRRWHSATCRGETESSSRGFWREYPGRRNTYTGG